MEQALVWIYVIELARVGRTRSGGAAIGICAVVVLRPQAMKHKRWVRGALGGVGMGVAELRRPGEIEQVEIEPGTAW
jgi:non-ribosomal peptide synthetase component E (peptide arylation enzyme)